MKKYDREWIYEKQAMQKKYNAVMKGRMAIRDVPESQSAIAYTSDEPAIYLKKDSKFTKGLDEHKARGFRFGLFTREMLRQKFTNFKYQEEISEKLEPYEIPIFRLICSAIEGAAIEMAAPSLVGGYLLNSLRYASKRIHDGMANIDSADTPFQEFMLALEQTAEVGTLKGKFITPAARAIYYKCYTAILDATEELDSGKRVDLCLKIHNTSKPLWEIEAKSSYDYGSTISGFAKMLGSAMSWMAGGTMTTGSGSGSVDPEEIEEMADFTKGAYRETVYHDISELSEEEQEEYRKQKEEQEVMRKERLSLAEEEEEKDDSIDYAQGDGWDRDEVFFDKSDAGDLSTIYDYDPQEDEIDVKGCNYFHNLVRSELEQAMKEDIAASITAIKEPLDLPEIATKYTARNYACKNLTARLTNRSEAADGYNLVKMEYDFLITNCYNIFKALFAEESEETVYKSSGKLSLKRSVSGTVTSKMFTKKVDPKDKSNMAVMLVIDESGSMSGARIHRAKTAAICLGEIFKKLGIPLYIMGFTADTGGTDVLHTHYAMWSGASDDLLKLTSIHAKANNFDGYSIRYASKVLDKRSENHKVMIVISDGQPACSAYCESDKGLRDTRDAISEARNRDQTVLGVAIGADLMALQEMYGNDFVYIQENEDLFSGIINKFTDIVKAW